MEPVSAIIPAAGYGLRLGKAIPKALVLLDRKPIFIHTLEIITRHPYIKEVILVVPPSYVKLFRRKIEIYRIKKIKSIVEGGITRQESVRNALRYIGDKIQWILVHDAVRPFIDLKMLYNLISKVKRYKAVSLGIPVNSTLKRIDKKMFVEETVSREFIWEAQTPQLFKRDLIFEAHRKFKDNSFNDDAAMVERLGVKVKMIRGSFLNIKITEPEDLILARIILKHRKYGL